MRLEPDNLQVVYTYAVALHDLGQPAEALRVIQRALTRHPDAAALRQLLEAYSEASEKPGRVLR
jgi:predicted Zn-dependent protease